MTTPDISSGASSDAPEEESEYQGLKPSKRAEIISAIVAFGVFALLTFLASGIELRREMEGIDPRWWPRALGTLGMVLAVGLILVAATRTIGREDIEQSTRQGRIRFGIALLTTVVFIVLWPLAGFIPVTLGYVLILTYVFGGRGWKTLIFFPVGVTAFLYLLFHMLLKVPL